MRTSKTHRARAWTLFLALALLLGQLGAFVHHSTEPHEVCDEHGELVHAPTLPGVDGADEAAARSEGPLAARSGEGDLAEHGHCGLTLARRGELARVAAPAALIQPIVDLAAGPELERRALGGVAPILQAPKQSPPV